MKEKILALLVAKFAGVRKDGLAQLAGALSLQADNDAEATALVEKLTSEKVGSFVTDLRKDVDSEVSKANKTYEEGLKKKFEFVEKTQTPPAGGQQQPNIGGEEPPAWAKALIDQNKAMAEKLQNFETGKTTEARLSLLSAKFEGVPGTYKAQQLEYNKMIIGSMTDEQFAAHASKIDADVAGFKQELANKGMAGQPKPVFGSKDNQGVSTQVAAYVESMKKEDNLQGKKI